MRIVPIFEDKSHLQSLFFVLLIGSVVLVMTFFWSHIELGLQNIGMWGSSNARDLNGILCQMAR
jgi:hypothetical protein